MFKAPLTEEKFHIRNFVYGTKVVEGRKEDVVEMLERC
jgi:hypothetical protein